MRRVVNNDGASDQPPRLARPQQAARLAPRVIGDPQRRRGMVAQKLRLGAPLFVVASQSESQAIAVDPALFEMLDRPPQQRLRSVAVGDKTHIVFDMQNIL